MKNFITYLFLLILFHSCAPYEPTKEEKQEVFKKVKYDKTILANFSKYDSLAQLLVSHSDAVFTYMDSRNYVTVVDSNKESKVLTPERSYLFIDGNPYYDIKKIPDFLACKADSLWTSVSKPEMEIYKKKEPALLSVRVSFVERENNVLECHFLYWHLTDFDNYDSFDFVKDTTLSADCVYRIGITTNHSGW